MKKIFLKVGFIFCLMLFLSGCFATIYPFMQVPEHKKSTSFQIGQDQQIGLGDPMIIEEDLFFYKGLKAIADYEQPKQFGVYYPPIKEGALFKLYGNLKNGDKAYQEINGEPAKDLYGTRMQWTYCIVVNATGQAYGITACTMEAVTKWPAPVDFLKEAMFYQKDSFRKELIYNGKSKDSIKLLYREFNDDMARPAFSQELSYDLAESKTIGFRKMKIEIIEATNSYIKFIVRSSMN